MKNDQPASERDPGSPRSDLTAATGDLWTIQPGHSDFPPQLAVHALSDRWQVVNGLGRRDILQQKCLGLICSVQCPGSVVIKTFDAIRELRDAGVVVAGGFHSPMEQECLEFLLRGEQPVVVCPATFVGAAQLTPACRTALDAGRLLVISPLGEDVRRATAVQARNRNEFVTALSSAVLIPHASPAGKAEVTAQNVVQRGQRLFTFDEECNAGLLSCGARPYDIAEIKGQVASNSH
jgi:predicted Rossmann fold nucleotide-binding protein DprA/Smf involved in DNA uptake